MFIPTWIILVVVLCIPGVFDLILMALMVAITLLFIAIPIGGVLWLVLNH